MENNKDNEQPTSDGVGLPDQQFDLVAKEPFYVFPEDMLRFLMNGFDFEFIEHVDSKLTTVEVRNMDVLIKVRLEGSPVLIDCEIQTEDIMNESSVYQMIIERGKKLGVKAFAIQRIRDLLNRRFNM